MEKLLNFKVNAINARKSILGFVEILRIQGEGYVKQGAESTDLGIQRDEMEESPRPTQAGGENYDATMQAAPDQDVEAQPPNSPLSNPISVRSGAHEARLSSPSLPQQSLEHGIRPDATQDQSVHMQRPHLGATSAFVPFEATQADQQWPFEVCHPFFDPAMPSLISYGEVPDVSQFGAIPMSLGDLEFGPWDMPVGVALDG